MLLRRALGRPKPGSGPPVQEPLNFQRNVFQGALEKLSLQFDFQVPRDSPPPEGLPDPGSSRVNLEGARGWELRAAVGGGCAGTRISFKQFIRPCKGLLPADSVAPGTQWGYPCEN